MKIKLNSRLSVKTIDLLAITTAPSFTIPEGVWTIKAIAQTSLLNTNIYAQNGDFFYLIQVWEVSNQITDLLLFQNIATICPDTRQGWDEARAEVGLRTLILDDLVYDRSWDGSDRVALTSYTEQLTDLKGLRNIRNEYMIYKRETDPGAPINKPEFLMPIFETDDTAHTAGISYYVGYRLNPICLTIAG